MDKEKDYIESTLTRDMEMAVLFTNCCIETELLWVKTMAKAPYNDDRLTVTVENSIAGFLSSFILVSKFCDHVDINRIVRKARKMADTVEEK